MTRARGTAPKATEHLPEAGRLGAELGGNLSVECVYYIAQGGAAQRTPANRQVEPSDTAIPRRIVAPLDQPRTFHAVSDSGDRGAVQPETFADLGPAHAILVPEQVEHGVLDRRHAERRERIPETPGNLLRRLGHEKTQAVVEMIHGPSVCNTQVSCTQVT